MKKETFNHLFNLFPTLLIIGFSCFVLAGKIEVSINQSERMQTSNNNVSGYQNIIDNCKNLTLKESSDCAVNEIKKFYKYVLTDDALALTFEELKDRGGDCKNWAELYWQIGYDLGFYANTEVISINKSISHRITIWSNNEGYCVIDQTNYVCWLQ